MSVDVYLYFELNTGREIREVEAFTANYTHNVSDMWRKAGCYDAIYRGEGKLAKDILPALEQGYANMSSNMGAYAELNPKNGWGDCESALVWLGEYIEACRNNPMAHVHVWR